MSDDDSLDQPNGELQIGSYRLIERLGSGGMSSVLRAVHVETGHEVAVKVLPRYLAKNPILLQRFLREAKNAESLEHPNIVAIYDRGFDQGRYYLVLEYIAGGDLHDRVKREGPLPLAEAVRIVRSTCEGLRFAASRGLIHRDVKPANLLLTPEGQVKITDLGLALQTEEEDERVTRDGTTVGTVDFMAPEQARDSRATSARSDMYSLGCSFYYMLTGSPPYPGGDVVDKLRRHIAEPPPDLRLARPDAPDSLVRLLAKMMAKRPEDRFADYDQLIAALDDLRLDGSASAAEPLYALIDEPEEAPQPLYALIDDEDDQAALPPAPLRPGLAPPASTQDINLAALAPLEEEEDEPDEPWPVLASGSAPERKTAKKPLLVFDETSGELPLASSYNAGLAEPPLRRTNGVKLHPWVLIGILTGAAMLVFGFGVLMFSSPSNPTEESTPETEPVAPVIAKVPAVPAGPRPIAKVTPRKTQPAGTPPASQPPPAVARTAPRDVPEASYPPEVVAKFLPEWAGAPIPRQVEGPQFVVERVPGSGDSRHVSQLWRALEKRGGTVELADCGPFFEDDFRIAGKDRLIRSRAGLRSIVVVDPPVVEFVKAQPAVIMLETARLVLDGIDLVVNVANLPANQTALFLCRGSDLELHNCTVTVINPARRPFTLVQAEAPAGGTIRPSKVRIEKTLVRGNVLTAFSIQGGAAEVAVSRSVVACANAPIASIAINSLSETGKPRRFHFVRSVLASPGPAFRISGPAAGAASVRALGTTFARLSGEGAAALIALKDDSGATPHDAVDWLGDDNVYSGWTEWMQAGAGPSSLVADLAAARSTWPGSDLRSQSTRALPAPESLEWFHPLELERLAPERLATLVRVAAPRPYLREKTVGAFDRLPVPPGPERRTLPPPLADRGGPRMDSSLMRKQLDAMTNGLPEGIQGSGRRPGGASGPPGPGREDLPVAENGEILFDARAPAWQGDLGRFLLDQFKPGVTQVRVLACGSGNHPMTPVKVPDGVALAVAVDSASLGRADPLSWTARAESGAEALFDAKNSDLRLTGVRLSWRDQVPGLKHLVRVEGGSLALSQCWLRAPAAAGVEGASLIALRTAGGATITAAGALAPLPAFRLLDCLLLTAGDAFTANLTHGVVALENCAVASGGRAFVLRPQEVSRDRADVDLWLDRCTIVAESGFVDLGPWPGPDPAPDRPWLISTRGTAWIAARNRSTESVLLRVDAETMAQGTLAWQTQGDAADVVNFTASGSTPVPATKRPDLRHQWVNLWGATHITAMTGPNPTNPRPSVRLLSGSLRPGQVGPNELALDPTYHPGRTTLDVGADLRPITLKGAASRPGSGTGMWPGRSPYGTNPLGPASPQ